MFADWAKAFAGIGDNNRLRPVQWHSYREPPSLQGAELGGSLQVTQHRRISLCLSPLLAAAFTGGSPSLALATGVPSHRKAEPRGFGSAVSPTYGFGLSVGEPSTTSATEIKIGMTHVSATSAAHHQCGVLSRGRVRCAGESLGQLIASTISTSLPQSIALSFQIRQITAIEIRTMEIAVLELADTDRRDS